MLRVILDSNILFVPFQFRVDIFDELEALLGKYEPIVLSTTMDELKSLTKKRSAKMQRQASSAFELVRRCKVVDVEKKPSESYDDIILRIARESKSPVATNDKELRRKLRGEGVAVIFLRQKSHLEMEGQL